MKTLLLLGFAALLSPAKSVAAAVQPDPFLVSSVQTDEPSALPAGSLADMEARLDKLGRCIGLAMLTSRSRVAAETVEHAYGACDTQTAEVRRWFSDNAAPKTFDLIFDGMRARSSKVAKDIEARARAEGAPLRW